MSAEEACINAGMRFKSDLNLFSGLLDGRLLNDPDSDESQSDPNDSVRVIRDRSGQAVFTMLGDRFSEWDSICFDYNNLSSTESREAYILGLYELEGDLQDVVLGALMAVVQRTERIRGQN